MACLACSCLPGQTDAPSRERKVALIIGNDVYRYVTPLKTAVNDARAMDAVLQERYGFETTLLMNASRAKIMAALSSYRQTLGPNSSLLIYYAGHGYADPAADKTYWWPVDAQPGDVSEWISADDITTSLKTIAARHILVVSDSCFSGTLSRGTTVPGGPIPGGDRAVTLMKLRQRSSRELLASGGNEPVADSGAGDHSVFAGAFLRALQSMEPAEFSVEEIFREVRESVGGRSSQLPELDPLRNSGHDGGSFVFSRGSSHQPIRAAAPQPILSSSNSHAGPAVPLRAPVVAPSSDMTNWTIEKPPPVVPPLDISSFGWSTGKSPGDCQFVYATKESWFGRLSVFLDQYGAEQPVSIVIWVTLRPEVYGMPIGERNAKYSFYADMAGVLKIGNKSFVSKLAGSAGASEGQIGNTSQSLEAYRGTGTLAVTNTLKMLTSSGKAVFTVTNGPKPGKSIEIPLTGFSQAVAESGCPLIPRP